MSEGVIQKYASFVTLGLLCSVCLFFLLGLNDLPIYAWDEGRVAVNALEMLQSGHLLVTTYGGHPDLWNTKPPLAIWLEVGSMTVLGVSEFALRLPSALAGVSTTMLVYAFAWRVSGSYLAGLVAALVLMGCAGYVGVHVTRTGDYDAILVLFTTMAAIFLWLAMDTDGHLTHIWLMAMGAAIGLAALTKGIAAAMVLPGFALYILLSGRSLRLLGTKPAWFAGALALGLPLAFYIARELAAPGYLVAVSTNEFGSRFLHSIAGTSKPWFFYMLNLAVPPTDVLNASAWPWALVVPATTYLALSSKIPATRSAGTMCAITLSCYLVVISAASTRVSWYAAPAFPFIAILVALGAHRLWHSTRFGLGRYEPDFKAAVICLLATPAVLWVAMGNQAFENLAAHEPATRTAAIARRVLLANSTASIRIVHDGHGATLEGMPYVAPEEFYAMAARRRGQDVHLEQSSYSPTAGQIIIWCQADLRRPFAVAGRNVLSNSGCRAVRAD